MPGQVCIHKRFFLVFTGMLLAACAAWTEIHTATSAPRPTLTIPPPAAAGPLGYPGNPVTANYQWMPVMQEFDGVEMVLVPAGCFMMGSDNGKDDERPVHQQCFDEPFWIDRTEVTNGRYEQYEPSGWIPQGFGGYDRPRVYMTWFDAKAFCESRGARLPTEAEWEYAARGPDGWEYPWGNEFNSNYVVWNTGQTADVGSKPGGASWVGALDMSGNVWEWVNDWYSETYYGTLAGGAVNPQGSGGQFRGLRGGSWNSKLTSGLRAGSRGWGDPTRNGNDLGFRCARSY